MLKQKPFHCAKFVIAPIKGFWLVREMQECTKVFISQEKRQKKLQKCKEKMLFKLILTYLVLL